MYPMTYCSFEREGAVMISVVWADSSGLILQVIGEGNFDNWIGTEHTLHTNRLLQAGWKVNSRGKVFL